MHPQVMKDPYTSYTSRPEDGCYIRGLFVEGARWDMDSFELAESRPKELYTDMPVMWLIPTADRKQPESGIYFCPVYKTLTRAGEFHIAIIIIIVIAFLKFVLLSTNYFLIEIIQC